MYIVSCLRFKYNTNRSELIYVHNTASSIL